MSVKSQEMKITVQVKISGYRDVQALKAICALANTNICLNEKMYGKKKYERITTLINKIFDLP